jgi:peptidoglycan hydrolase CwlO-like protein
VQELCERDRIIEEKQSQIEQQSEVLVKIQITLDEKQLQIDALRSSLAARDSSIVDLETRLAKAEANSHNLRAKLDASVHEASRLREEVILLIILHNILFRSYSTHLCLLFLCTYS